MVSTSNLSTSEVSCAWAEKNFTQLMDQVSGENSVAIISRPNQDPVAMLPAKELSSLLETLHLLRSPTNAQRLFSALERAGSNQGTPKSLDELKMEIDAAL
ncbi:MAG: type II toxin-antitoxin system Phd/YefM family antitoxin [Cyanobacteria bacterium P01_F01_bin.150]